MTKLAAVRTFYVMLPVLAGATPSLASQTRGQTIVARLQPGNQVEIVDPMTGKARSVYRSPRWATRDLTVSPDGELLGLVEVEQGQVEGSGYRVLPASELVVLNTTGSIVRRVAKRVQRYVWCGNTCLAYIVGDYSEGGPGFIPESAFVHNLASSSATLVSESLRPVDLRWAQFDSSVYLKVYRTAPDQARIYRYHLATAALSSTPNLDLHFSASGRYYLHLPDESDQQFRLYDVRTNREVRVSELAAIGVPLEWVFTGPNHLLIARASTAPRLAQPPGGLRRPPPKPALDSGRDVDYAIFDLDARRIVRSLRGRLLRWSAPAGTVLFLTGGRLNAILRP